jgi:uncharacterized coiled-coil protein SlyX
MTSQGTTTSIPVQSVDADQLPREKGLTVEEVSSIIGGLYLDSAHQTKVREEQFTAVVEEYDKRMVQLQAQLQSVQQELQASEGQVIQMRNELEKRNGPRTPSASGNDGDN